MTKVNELFFLLGALILVCTCAEDVQSVSLIDHSSWQVLPVAEDPFAELLGDRELCPLSAFGTEGVGAQQVFEVETNYCGYLTIGQQSLVSIETGDTLTWSMWHLPLVAAQASEGYVGVMVAGHLVWELRVSIPSDEAVYKEAFSAGFSADAGAEVLIHLRNHGSNSWRFHQFERRSR